MPVEFSSLLAETLSARGYEVEDTSPLEGNSGASYPVSLVAHRENDTYLVDALASRTVRDEDVQAVASIVDDTEVDGAILLALAGAENSESGPGFDLVDVWDRADVEAALGSYVLERHLTEGVDPDEIGPSPVELYEVPREAQDTASPARAGHDPPAAQAAEPDEPAAAASPGPEEPAPRASPPEPTPEPEPEPQAATAEAQTDPAEPEDDVNHRDFVDPEDMLERAEQLMQQGAVDDGDAELIVEDDDEAEPPASPDTREPATANETPARSPDPPPEDGAAAIEDEGDAELLDPDSTEESTSRPQPTGEAPEPESATTVRNEASSEDEDQTGGAESPAAVAGDEEADSFVSGATIEPRIDETEARRKAEEALFEADGSRLELLPFNVFAYEARLEGDGHHREEEGRVWVSTQSGAVVRAPTGDLVDEPEVAHERFQGSLSAAETQEAAREHLLETLERRDEIRQDYSESAVIERVMLEPDPDDLELTRLGKAFAPRWRIEGRNGTVFVDAVTGELVNE